jgi:putative protease
MGAEHILRADSGCRNTLFNAAAQTGAVRRARSPCGLRHFRLEFMTEAPPQVTTLISKYKQLLRGEIAGTDLWRELKMLSQLGVTRGTLQ